MQVIQAIFFYLNEVKKIQDSDITFIAKFIFEFIRRYPDYDDDKNSRQIQSIESVLEEALKQIGSQNNALIEKLNKHMFLLYCELCLDGVIVGKEKIVYKMIKIMLDTVTKLDVFFKFVID